MTVQIITCNTLYKRGKYFSGFHEIHEILNLQNKEHLIATINSIFLLNTLYSPKESVLDNIIINGDNNEIIGEVIKYYNENPIEVPVIETQSSMA